MLTVVTNCGNVQAYLDLGSPWEMHGSVTGNAFSASGHMKWIGNTTAYNKPGLTFARLSVLAMAYSREQVAALHAKHLQMVMATCQTPAMDNLSMDLKTMDLSFAHGIPVIKCSEQYTTPRLKLVGDPTPAAGPTGTAGSALLFTGKACINVEKLTPLVYDYTVDIIFGATSFDVHVVHMRLSLPPRVTCSARRNTHGVGHAGSVCCSWRSKVRPAVRRPRLFNDSHGTEQAEQSSVERRRHGSGLASVDAHRVFQGQSHVLGLRKRGVPGVQ